MSLEEWLNTVYTKHTIELLVNLSTSYFGTMSVKVSDLVKPYVDSNKSGDFSDWCEKLELVAGLQKISDLQSFLPLFLEGPAFAVYKQLGSTVQGDYEQLKEALLLAFGQNSFSAYEQLKGRILQDNETVDVYIADLKRLATLMGQGNAEPLLRCAFISGLPAATATQLKSVVAVETLSLPYLVSRARMMLATTRSASPTLCAAGQMQKQERRCFSCGLVGHMARDCRRKNTNVEKRACYRCNQLGHLVRDCTAEVVMQGNISGGASSAPGASPKQ